MFAVKTISTTMPVDFYVSTLSKKELDEMAQKMWNDFPWEDHTTNRRELFCSEASQSYTYGSEKFARTYHAVPAPLLLNEVKHKIEDLLNDRFEYCFVNGYASEKEHLGYHADDSSSIDHTRPIVVASFGAERAIWVKPIGGSHDTVEKFSLPSGSLFVMKPGMQHTHLHRIPKNPSPCGFRVSLTFRGAK